MARKVVLVTPYNELGVMVEDIVSKAVEIATRHYKLDIDFTVFYKPSSSIWTLVIDNTSVSFNRIPSLEEIVDLLTIASVPESTLISIQSGLETVISSA